MATTNRSVEAAWDVIHNWLQGNCPAVLQSLKPPASDGDLKALEDVVGVVLPDDFKASYGIHDGSARWPGPIVGLPMLSSKDIAKRWTGFKSFVKDWEEMLPIHASYKEGVIKEDAINPKWIPFLGPDEDNYVALDLDPGPAGLNGQVINFGADQFKYESNRFVLASSFGDFLNLVADLMSDDKVVVDDEGCLWLKQTRDDGTKCNLLTGITMLFGDPAGRP